MRSDNLSVAFLRGRTHKSQSSRESPTSSNLLALASWRLGVRYFFSAWRGLHPASLPMLRVRAFGGSVERQPRAESIIAQAQYSLGRSAARVIRGS
jgi:hypothetical protein